MELTKKQMESLSFILNRAAHKYAGDEAGAGDKDDMYDACSNWSRLFESAAQGKSYYIKREVHDVKD